MRHSTDRGEGQARAGGSLDGLNELAGVAAEQSDAVILDTRGMTACREQSRRDGEVACFTETSRHLPNCPSQPIHFLTLPPRACGPQPQLRPARRVGADLAEGFF